LIVEKLIDKVIFKVIAGTAMRPTYLIIARLSE